MVGHGVPAAPLAASLIVLFAMKTFFTIVVTGVVTWIAAAMFHGFRTGTDRLWMVSAMKAPGRMAISDIQADLNAGRYDMAKKKVDALLSTWQRFSSEPNSCRGAGIGDIMVTFSKIAGDANVGPGGPAKESQTVRSETNRTSPASDSRR
jgi:hypothetical protein